MATGVVAAPEPVLGQHEINDISLSDYIGVQPSKHATYVPHTAGRYSVKRFRKAQCPIIERLTNSLMMHGRNNGKKLMAVRIIRHAMEIIHLLTNLNPIQAIVDDVVQTEMTRYRVTELLAKMIPFGTAEECGKAIVRSACRGDKYLVIPSWYKLMFPLTVACSEVVEFFNHR